MAAKKRRNLVLIEGKFGGRDSAQVESIIQMVRRLAVVRPNYLGVIAGLMHAEMNGGDWGEWDIASLRERGR